MAWHRCPECGRRVESTRDVVPCMECMAIMQREPERPSERVMRPAVVPQHLRGTERLMVDNGRRPSW